MRFLDTVEKMRGSLDYHLARHNLLTANLAQIDTPGFRPLDLERTSSPSSAGSTGSFKSAMQQAMHSGMHSGMESGMTTTDPKHIGVSKNNGSLGAGRVVVDPTMNPGLDNNTVSIDREAVKITTNQLRYDILTSLTREELSTISWAVTDGRM